MDSKLKAKKRGRPRLERTKTPTEIDRDYRTAREAEGLVRVRFWIDEDLRDRLVEISERRGCTKGKLLEQALKRELADG